MHSGALEKAVQMIRLDHIFVTGQIPSKLTKLSSMTMMGQTSNLIPSEQFQAAMGSPIDKSELAALKEELRKTKHQLALFHDSWRQSMQACEAWKKEAEGAANLESKLREMEGKVRSLQSAAPLRALTEGTDVNRLPLSKLESIQQQLRGELERIETVSICTVLIH